MSTDLSQAAILRVIASLVAAERAVHGGGRAWDASGWTAATELGPDGLAFDSLELVAAADVVSRFFRLHETDNETRLLSESTLGGWSRIVARSRLAGAEGFTFATTGTTGLPKLIRQPATTLFDEACYWRGRFESCRRVVQTVPAHHGYGFMFTVLLPDVTGWPVLDARTLPAGALVAALRPGDLLVSSPVRHAALLRAASRLPRDVHVISSTSHLAPERHGALLALGAAEVLDIYGSSETFGIGARGQPGQAFTLLPRWRRGATETEIIDIATEAAVTLPDRVTWEGERRLRPVVRLDGAVLVAGIVVFPAVIADRLRAHPLVAECAVYLDTTLPEPRLRARVVPVPGHDPAAVAATCDRWCRRHFTAPERPVGLDMVATLPAPQTQD